MSLGVSQLVFAVVVLGVALMIAVSKLMPHSEAALMSDIGPPPPLPVFLAANALASLLRSIADALTPPQIRMVDSVAMAYHRTGVAYVLQKHKIPDFLGEDDGRAKTIEEIAQFTETKDVERVERIMYAAAAFGMTELVREKTFVNNGLSAVLRRDHPDSMAGWIGHNWEESLLAWAKGAAHWIGPDAMVTPWEAAFPDYPGTAGFWNLLETYPKQEEQFSRAMKALEGVGGWAMAIDGPFGECERFVDVGGSRGHFLMKLLQTYEGKPGVLFDRPPVIKIAAENFPADLKSKVTFAGGDFFDSTSLPDFHDGDCVYLRLILHDWADNQVTTILKNLRQAMGSKQVSLMVGESNMVDRDAVSAPPAVHAMDMQMLALFASKERYPKYWEKLFADAGFRYKATTPTRSQVAWTTATPA